MSTWPILFHILLLKRTLIPFSKYRASVTFSLDFNEPTTPNTSNRYHSPPPRRHNGLVHTSAVYSEASASPSHCASDSTRVSISLCRCLVTLSAFLLSDIFNGEYLTLMFSFLHLCLFSTPYFFYLGCACVLIFLWIQVAVVRSRLLLFRLLGEVERVRFWITSVNVNQLLSVPVSSSALRTVEANCLVRFVLYRSRCFSFYFDCFVFRSFLFIWTFTGNPWANASFYFLHFEKTVGF